MLRDPDELEKRIRDLESLLDLEMAHADNLLSQLGQAEARAVVAETALAGAELRRERDLVPSRN